MLAAFFNTLIISAHLAISSSVSHCRYAVCPLPALLVSHRLIQKVFAITLS